MCFFAFLIPLRRGPAPPPTKIDKPRNLSLTPSFIFFIFPFSHCFLDDAFWAQARFDGLRGLSDGFVQGFVEHCAKDYPLLPSDLGATGLQTFRVDALGSTAAREKSAVHRCVDNNEFLKRFFAAVSPGSRCRCTLFQTCHVRLVRYLVFFFTFCIICVISAFVLQ